MNMLLKILERVRRRYRFVVLGYVQVAANGAAEQRLPLVATEGEEV